MSLNQGLTQGCGYVSPRPITEVEHRLELVLGLVIVQLLSGPYVRNRVVP